MAEGGGRLHAHEVTIPSRPPTQMERLSSDAEGESDLTNPGVANVDDVRDPVRSLN